MSGEMGIAGDGFILAGNNHVMWRTEICEKGGCRVICWNNFNFRGPPGCIEPGKFTIICQCSGSDPYSTLIHSYTVPFELYYVDYELFHT